MYTTHWPSAEQADIEIHVYALGLHLAALNWLDTERVFCADDECCTQLRPEHILDPRFQGFCVHCADLRGVPVIPPF